MTRKGDGPHIILRFTDRPRATKTLNFDDVTVLVSVLRASGAQVKRAPLTKPQIAELTGLSTVRSTAAYKTLLKLELAGQIDPRKDMPFKGTYLKITAKGKSYYKAYDLLFAWVKCVPLRIGIH